ncbi:MAG: hypothetical protein GXX89_09500 [Clostridiales bacterium]|nr:hypothetical protein [Clostridiales bacterium]
MPITTKRRNHPCTLMTTTTTITAMLITMITGIRTIIITGMLTPTATKGF